MQGVGFRYSTQQAARGLGIVGWVRNTDDNRVEVLAVGNPEQIAELVKWCGQGPPGARVDGVEITSERERDTLAFTRFEVRR